jgi:hypothetical protein
VVEQNPSEELLGFALLKGKKNMHSIEAIYPRAFEQTALAVSGDEFALRNVLVLRAEKLL